MGRIDNDVVDEADGDDDVLRVDFAFADQFADISETCMVSAWRERAEWLCEL